jgi:hypothetical protein
MAAAGAGPFSWFVAKPPPAGWKHLTPRPGTAVLWFPPSLQPIHADISAVSAALRDRDGNFLAYLNSTPRQGGERLSTWPDFRLAALRARNVAVREVGRAFGLSFRGGTGSCVIDDYVTRVGSHRFQEIACLVLGQGTGGVVVAAAPPTEWGRLGPQLERAISAYEVNGAG